MSSPVKLQRFFAGDLVFPGVLLIALVAAIWATITPQDPPVSTAGWAILWSVPAVMLLINVLLAIQRESMGSALKYEYRGVVVAWENPQWAVPDVVFQPALDAYINKLKAKYPKIEDALKGCVILFREPKWTVDARPNSAAKYVAGLQDNTLIYVGWNADLSKTAFEHELTHRVFQVFEGDPPQDKAHQMMQAIGIS